MRVALAFAVLLSACMHVPAPEPLAPPTLLITNEGLASVTVYDNDGRTLGFVDSGQQRCLRLPSVSTPDYWLVARPDMYTKVYSPRFKPAGAPGWSWRLDATSTLDALALEPAWPCEVVA